jgi:cytochrome P450
MADPFPTDAIAAVTHRNPYPYYAHLVAHQPLYRDESLGLWVASSADAVTAVLTSELCRVRPLSEPVPTALLGTPAANIFRKLIRMNDGSGHCPFNRAVAATLTSIDPSHVAQRTIEVTKHLLDQLDPAIDIANLNDVAFKLSPYVIGGLLGIPDNQLEQTSRWVGDFVRCVVPASTIEQIEGGKVAAGNLQVLFNEILEGGDHGENGLFRTLAREAERIGYSDCNTIVANGIGFLSQAYESTAGLIGNTLLALAIHDTVRGQVADDTNLLRDLIYEMLRYDPPGHNTRRFVANDGVVFGQKMKSGDAILVVTAAANRDPKINPQPERFELRRENRRLLTFGAGNHACPGEAFATSIAQAGVATLLESGLDVKRLLGSFTYRASVNTRVPLFANANYNNAKSVA